MEAWPTVRRQGRSGYSARHYAALAGAGEDPLSVAARLVETAIGEDVQTEARARLAAGSLTAETVGGWISAEVGRRRASAWSALSLSFDKVIHALEHEVARRPTPALRSLLRQARTAARGGAS